VALTEVQALCVDVEKAEVVTEGAFHRASSCVSSCHLLRFIVPGCVRCSLYLPAGARVPWCHSEPAVSFACCRCVRYACAIV
jgi:hypothetical protein